jgi:monovalent cation/hydrogen antiporter
VDIFETVLLMLLLATLLLGVARRTGAPHPTLLALAGTGLALLPVRFTVQLDPQLVLALFVAPVLVDAAYDFSIRDLRRYWRPVLGLVLVAVALSTAAVAFLARWLVPDLPWAAAVALGAIVAPPDAAAATAVLRQARLPHRVTVILEGESLLNDATALLIYRLAVGAAMGEGGGVGAIAPAFALGVLGSVAAGYLIAAGWQRLSRRVSDVPSSIILQFVSTFGVWLLAERLHLSPVLTVVAYAMFIARDAPARMSARLRVPAYAVWETAVLVLNTLAFVLIGLQLGDLLRNASGPDLRRWFAFGGAILVCVMTVRLCWTLASVALGRLDERRTGRRESPGARGERATWRGGLLIGWCGMRGIVTVAAALALPGNFPGRDLLLVSAFIVTLGTLLIQGLTLRPLLLALRLPEDGLVEGEVRLARVALAEAALDACREDDTPYADGLRRDLELERDTARDARTGEGRVRLPSKALVARTVARRRDRLLELRRQGVIGGDAFHRLEEELDLADLAAALRA